MTAIHAVIGPRDAGPGERQQMLEMARALLERAAVDGIDRFDVPGRGAAEEGDGDLRLGLDRLVPALQSGSLFGGSRGVLLVDAHNLQATESAVVAELAEHLDPAAITLVMVAEGSLPAVLARLVKARGESLTVRKMREKDAVGWLREAARDRRIRLDPEAATLLIQRFGTDTAAMGQALDQLAAAGGPVTGAEVAARFRNRPDEPMWLYADAVGAGDTGQALRRLADFLTHGHPLQLIAFLESDLERRALAAAAGSIQELAEWLGASADHYPVQKAWNGRNAAGDDELRRALQALARADLTIKTRPEETHRVTLERLTVALCRWYRGRG